MKFNSISNSIKLIIAVAFLGLNSACQPEDAGDGNGLNPSNLDGSFTVTNVSTNRFTLTGNNKNNILSKWDLDDGAGFFNGTDLQNIFLPDAGTYIVKHKVYGQGGVEGTVATQTINVAASDPNSGNLVVGGKFETAADISNWTVLNISASGTNWTFANGKATVTGGGWNQQAFYQAINVVAGKTYSIDMVCSSTTGVSNTWFEVYASSTMPVQNNDYSAGGKKRNINTWAGCGGTPFSGKISNIGCSDSGTVQNDGVFTATTTGVIYLVIKCGGENLQGGISVDNVEFRGV